jgi:hypothetical protein
MSSTKASALGKMVMPRTSQQPLTGAGSVESLPYLKETFLVSDEAMAEVDRHIKQEKARDRADTKMYISPETDGEDTIMQDVPQTPPWTPSPLPEHQVDQGYGVVFNHDVEPFPAFDASVVPPSTKDAPYHCPRCCKHDKCVEFERRCAARAYSICKRTGIMPYYAAQCKDPEKCRRLALNPSPTSASSKYKTEPQREYEFHKALSSFPEGAYLRQKLVEKGVKWDSSSQVNNKLHGEPSGIRKEDRTTLHAGPYRQHVFDLFSAPATVGAIGAE